MDTGGHRLDPDDLLGASAVRAAVDALMLRSREHVAQMDADQVEAATAQCRGAALDVLAAVRAAIGSPAGEDEPRGRAVVVIEDDGGREVHFHAAFHPQLEESGEDGAFLGTAAQAAAVRMLSQMATEDAGGNAPALGGSGREAIMANDAELRHLRRCVELATEALEAGDEPFGSVLVAADGTVLAEDHNRVASGDRTRHPEFALARWAAANMTPGERAAATVFTSGEHCPMCAAAHGWVGLGRIVYVSSSEQLAAWLAELGVPAPPVRTLPIREIVPDLVVEGPVPGLAEQVRDLHRRLHSSS